MIAEQHVDLPGKLAFEGSEEIEQLVRLVAARGVLVRSVNELLKHQVTAGMFLQLRFLEHLAKVLHVAVQVAHDHDFAGFRQRHHPSSAARRVANGLNGLL